MPKLCAGEKSEEIFQDFKSHCTPSCDVKWCVEGWKSWAQKCSVWTTTKWNENNNEKYYSFPFSLFNIFALRTILLSLRSSQVSKLIYELGLNEMKLSEISLWSLKRKDSKKRRRSRCKESSSCLVLVGYELSEQRRKKNKISSQKKILWKWKLCKNGVKHRELRTQRRKRFQWIEQSKNCWCHFLDLLNHKS